MRIVLASVFVDDQEKALEFYTNVLGFRKKTDLPVGEYRWLTVVADDGPDSMELLLEPNAHSAAKAFQQEIYKQGIPATAFLSEDIKSEYKELSEKGVVFVTPPTETPHALIAVFDDTCGNLIQMFQPY